MTLFKSKNFTRLILVIIPLLFIVTSVVAYQKEIFSNSTSVGRQLASVGSLSCYYQADIDGLQASKTAADNVLLNFSMDPQLSDIESQIETTVKEIDANNASIEYLQSNLIPEDILRAERDEINVVQAKLAEANANSAPSNAGVCSNPGYYDRASCEGAGEYTNSYCSDPSYTDEYSCVNAGWNRTNGCSNPAYLDRVSCEGAGTEYSASSGGVSTNSCSMYGYSDQASCESAGYYDGSGYCSNTSYYDEYSCTNAGEFTYSWCSVPGYYDQASCESAGAMPGYCSAGGFGDESSCVNAGASSGYCSDGVYSDEYSCTSATCSYTDGSCSDAQYTNYSDCVNNGASWTDSSSVSCGNTWYPGSTSFGYTWYPGTPGSGQWYPGSFVNFGYTWNPPTFHSFNNTWNQSWYETFTSWFGSYGYTWTEPAWETYGNTWTPGTWNSYGYTWQPTTVQNQQAELEQALADLSYKYMQDLERNSAYADAILYAQEYSNTLATALAEQTKKKVDMKGVQSDMQQIADNLSLQLSSALANMCGTIIIDTDTTIVPPIVDTTITIDTPGTIPPTEVVTIVPYEIPASLGNNIEFVATKAKEVFNQNERSIVPQMKEIQDAGPTASEVEILSLIGLAKTKIEQGEVLLSKFNEGIAGVVNQNAAIQNPALKKDVLQFESAATTLAAEYATYYITLYKFLTGVIPTSSLYSELDTVVASLSNAGLAFETVSLKVKANLAAINNQQNLNFTAVSVVPGVDALSVPANTTQISVKFNTPVDSYDIGTSTVTSSGGSITRVTSASLNSARDTLTLKLDYSLEQDLVYTASLELPMTVKSIPLIWKKSWAFKTAQEAMNNNNNGFVDSVIDYVKSWLFLDDGDGNDGNDEDKGPSCGNSKVEDPEMCDVPGDEPGNGSATYCTSSCQIGCAEGFEMKYEGGTPTCVVKVPEVGRCDVLDEMGNSILDDEGKPVVKEGEVACHTEPAVPKKARGNKTCLICEYDGADTTFSGSSLFKEICGRLKAKIKPDAYVPIDSSTGAFVQDISSCPAKDYSTYKAYLVGHSTCANYQAAGLTMGTLGNLIVGEYDTIEDENYSTTLSVTDAGCLSAGGEYKVGGIAEKDFEGTIGKLGENGFIGNLTQKTNQTKVLGWYKDDQGNVVVYDVDSVYAQVIFKSSISDKNYKNPPVSVDFVQCPPEGTRCGAPSRKEKREAGDEYNIEGMICGEGERYYCEAPKSLFIDNSKGSWRKDKSF